MASNHVEGFFNPVHLALSAYENCFQLALQAIAAIRALPSKNRIDPEKRACVRQQLL